MSSAELTHVLAQQDALRAIGGGAPWLTDLGRRVQLDRPGSSDPPECIWWDSISWASSTRATAVRVTWAALVYDHGELPAEARALEAVADMRRALYSNTCPDVLEDGVAMDRRGDGSNYVVVLYTTVRNFHITQG